MQNRPGSETRGKRKGKKNNKKEGLRRILKMRTMHSDRRPNMFKIKI